MIEKVFLTPEITYWILANGEFVNSNDKHIITVYNNASMFNISKKYIEYTYQSFNEILFCEAKACSKIMVELLLNGNIKVESRPNLVIFNLLNITKFKLALITKFCKSLLLDINLQINIDILSKKNYIFSVYDILYSDNFIKYPFDIKERVFNDIL